LLNTHILRAVGVYWLQVIVRAVMNPLVAQ